MWFYSISASVACLGRCRVLPAQRTDNGDELIHFCADNGLFLTSTNFKHSSYRTATGCPNSTGSLSQIDHNAVGYHRHGSVQNYRSGRSTYLELGCLLVLIRFLLQLTGHERKSQTQLAVGCLFTVHTSYEQKILDQTKNPMSSNAGEQQYQIKQALHLATGFVCGSRSYFCQRH